MSTVDMIIEALQDNHRMTYREIEQLTGLPRYLISNKLAQMRRRGMLQTGPEVICPVSGYTAQTWKLAPGISDETRPALDDPNTPTEEIRERLNRIRRARNIIRRQRYAEEAGIHV